MTPENKIFNLRQRAEKKLKHLFRNASGFAHNDKDRLIHELQVHQIELEMQNEQLMETQRELEIARNRYMNLYDFAPAGYITISRKGVILAANLTIAEMLGVERTLMVGEYFFKFIDSKFQDIYYLHRKKVFKAETKQSCELKLVKKDGNQFYALLESIPVEDDHGGKIVRIRTIITDVSEARQAREALAESESKFRLVADYTYDFEYWMDQDGNYFYISPSCERITGYNPDEFISNPELLYEITAPDHTEKVRHHYQDENKKEFPMFSMEFQICAKNGKKIWIEHNCIPVYDDKGNYMGRRGNNRDITGRKKAEAALISSEKKWRDILINTPQIGLSLDPKGRITFVNRHFLILTGWEEHEVMGMDWFDLFIPENIREKVRKIFSAVMIRGNTTGFSNYENEILTKSGELRNVAWANVLNRDVSGNIIDVTSLGIDLTERKRAENELKYQKELLQKIMDTIPVFITLYDSKGNIFFVNKALEDEFGWTNEEIREIDLMEECFPDPLYRKKALEYMKKATTGWREFICTTKTGEKLASIWSNVKAEDGTQIGIGIDVTEKKALEAQLNHAQKMESVGRLAGGVAHDFNNVLSVIMGFAEIALMDTDPKEQLHKNINEILKAGRRAADITRQLLAFARKQTIAPRVLDLNRNVKNMLKMLGRLIGEDIELAWLPGEALWAIKMDSSQIDQILANLCVNARDAIEDIGRVTIESKNVTLTRDYCNYYPGSVPGDFVLLCVSDNGYGMTKEIQNKIFEPFFTTKDVDKGTGLGLATVYGIVKQNRGFINVYSEENKGTTIKVYLPRYKTRDSAFHGESTEDIPQGSGETILMVEDDIAILKIGQKMFEKLGYTVLTSSQPEKVKDIIMEYSGKISLVITDVVMPKMTGRDLKEQLQSIFPDLKCIFMSGYTADVIAHQGILDEGAYLIEKPFTIKDMAKTIRKVLDENKN